MMALPLLRVAVVEPNRTRACKLGENLRGRTS
jgi:hypothetical protein